MSKIVFVKVEVPCDDDVRVEDVRGAVRDAVRAIGRKDGFGAAPADGQATAERAAFFDAAAAKFYQPERRRGAAAPGVRAVKP